MPATDISSLTSHTSEDAFAASHAPCIQAKARIIRLFASLLMLAALVFFILDKPVMALFLGTASALLFFSLACLFTWSLLLWRDMRQGAFLYAVSDERRRYTLAPGEAFHMQVKLTNMLNTPLRVTETKLLSSSHLEAETISPFSLDPASVSEKMFAFKVTKRGPAAVYGVQFTFEDPWAMVKSVLLIALQTNIDLLSAQALPAREEHVGQGRSLSSDELDGIRPYQQGDLLKRIFWRGFARTGELMTRVQTRHEALHHVALLVDISPDMTKIIPDHETPLHAWLPQAKACIRNADAVTMFACTRREARLLVRCGRPGDAAAMLEDLCLQRHLFMRPVHREDWNGVVRVIWKDLACFRRRDFTRTIHKKPFIDSPVMLRWLRYDLAIQHPAEARSILRADDKTVATRYMRERRLEYESSAPHGQACFSIAQKRIRTFRQEIRPQEIWCLTVNGMKKCRDVRLTGGRDGRRGNDR